MLIESRYLSPAQVDLVGAISNRVYQRLRTLHTISALPIHQRGVCDDASELFQDEAARNGVNAELMFGRSTTNRDFHYHNRLWSLRIDLTWQQFLIFDSRARISQDMSTLPRVLVLSEANLDEELANYGIPTALRHYWTQAQVISSA